MLFLPDTFCKRAATPAYQGPSFPLWAPALVKKYKVMMTTEFTYAAIPKKLLIKCNITKHVPISRIHICSICMPLLDCANNRILSQTNAWEKHVKKGHQASCISSQIMEEKSSDQIPKQCHGARSWSQNASSNVVVLFCNHVNGWSTRPSLQKRTIKVRPSPLYLLTWEN